MSALIGRLLGRSGGDNAAESSTSKDATSPRSVTGGSEGSGAAGAGEGEDGNAAGKKKGFLSRLKIPGFGGRKKKTDDAGGEAGGGDGAPASPGALEKGGGGGKRGKGKGAKKKKAWGTSDEEEEDENSLAYSRLRRANAEAEAEELGEDEDANEFGGGRVVGGRHGRKLEFSPDFQGPESARRRSRDACTCVVAVLFCGLSLTISVDAVRRCRLTSG